VSWQFRKYKKVGPLGITAAKGGVGVSIGAGPLRTGLGADGKVRTTVRVPGTGLYNTQVVAGNSRTPRTQLSRLSSGLPDPTPMTSDDRLVIYRGGEAVEVAQQALAAAATTEVTDRDSGWECLLFAALLEIGITSLEDHWHDYANGVAHPTGERREDSVAAARGIDVFSNEMVGVLHRYEREMAGDTIERALNAAVELGDVTFIHDVAGGIVETYASMLDWATRVRGVEVPTPFQRLYWAMSLYADRPMRQLRAFVADLAFRVEAEAKILRQGGRLEDTAPLRLDLDLEIDLTAVAAFEDAMAELL
jgi:hypothetical protein